MVNENTYNTLLEFKFRNRFYKKEVSLIGVMIISLSIILFTLNKWNNLLSSILIITALLLVNVKLFSLFNRREKKYNILIKKYLKEVKSNLVKGSKSSDEESQVVFAYELPTTSSKFKETISIESPISDLLSERAAERRRKMKDFNYQFNQRLINTIEQDSYNAYISYIENRFNNKDIKSSEYKILLKFLLNYLKTENADVIENADSEFKEKIRTLTSQL